MISTKGRYALRLMIDIAEHAGEGRIPLQDVAERQAISKKYLEIIVKDLVSAKLLTGASGKGGGYVLSRAPEDYKIGEILEVTEGTLAAVACLSEGAEPCPRAANCRTLALWTGFDKLVHDYFFNVTLADMMKKP